MFDAAFCGTAYAGVAAGHKVLGALGRTGMPIVDVEAGCASGAARVLDARRRGDRAGQYETVLVFGLEKMPKGIIRSSFFCRLSGGGGPRRDARLLRVAGPAAPARGRP